MTYPIFLANCLSFIIKYLMCWLQLWWQKHLIAACTA